MSRGSVVTNVSDSVALIMSGRWISAPDLYPDDVLLKSRDGTSGYVMEGLGLGFAIGDGRAFMTCAHCVRYAAPRDVHLLLPGGTNLFSSVDAIHRSEKLDVAVLVAKDSRQPIEFDSSQGMAVGEDVYFWTPLFKQWEQGHRTVEVCLRRTIVSGIHRRPWTDGAHDRLLVDATVPPGSSGSPLVRGDGRLVGMVSEEEMTYSQYLTLPAGLGRAIPLSILKGCVEELRQTDKTSCP